MDKTDFWKLLDAPRKVESVPLPNGQTAFVRALTAGEMDQAESEKTALESQGHSWRSREVMLFACDSTGNPIFSRGDLANIAKLPATVTDSLILAANRLNTVRNDPTGKAPSAGPNGEPSSGSHSSPV